MTPSQRAAAFVSEQAMQRKRAVAVERNDVLAALRVAGLQGRVMSASEIAQSTGIKASLVHGYLRALIDLGLVRRVGPMEYRAVNPGRER